jgi:hypothetical protein
MLKFQRCLKGPASKAGFFKFSQDEIAIHVGFKSAEPTYCSSTTGFVEGLWRYDCGELFLADPLSGRYLEINLAPNGAWWSCPFSSVRVRDLQMDAPQIECIFSEPTADGWNAGFSLNWKEVERCLGTVQGLKGNVTIILGGCPDVEPPLQNLHSVAPLAAVDFHRPKEWLPLDQLCL